MVFYQVGDAELKIDASFLNVIKHEQAKEIRGVYGWYILSKDLSKLDIQVKTLERQYLYVGTVAGRCLKSVTSRFLGELCGAQVCTDKFGKKFDTDFAMSCVIAFLSEKGIDVYFHVLSEDYGRNREVEIARRVKPVLQTVTKNSVRLNSCIKREIVKQKVRSEDFEALGQAVVDRLRGVLTAD